MGNHFYGPLFKYSRKLVRLFYKPFSTGHCHIMDEPVVYVSKHQNLFGPFVTLLSFPKDLHCWILSDFLEKESCYRHYADYTFSVRFGWKKPLAKLAAFPVSRFVPALLKSGGGIPVYRRKRKIIETFKETVRVLKRGESVIIFPDIDYSNSSSLIGEMYEGFLYIDKYFYKETGEHVAFVPLYASKNKKSIRTGQPVQFRVGEPFVKEKKVVLKNIQNQLIQLAEKCGDI